MKKKISYILIVAIVAVIGGGLWCIVPHSAEHADLEPNAVKTTSQATRKARKAIPVARDERESLRNKLTRTRKGSDAGVTEEDFPEFGPADQKAAVELQNALDDNDSKRVHALASKAIESTDPAMRKWALEALDWIGEKALPEMATLIADPDEEVAGAAVEAASRALDEIEDPVLRFETSASYMTLLSHDANVQDSFSTILSAAASALCVPEDDTNPKDVRTATENRQKIVETLSEMMAKGGKLAEAVKESYSFVTGHDWAGPEEAKRWAQDPDKYEPPETDEDK